MKKEWAFSHTFLSEKQFRKEIKRLRAQRHPMLRRKWGAKDEIRTLIMIIRHQLFCEIESTEQIAEMLEKSGAKQKQIEHMLRAAQAA
ncbi:MAG TPA: hypothetical protein P5096_01485 [Patescibacteria group bacterium]|nr:hypothetical protein [Patescibacteria group bacterium]